MTARRFGTTALGVFLLFLAARGGNWLITPMRHPDATAVDYLLTWVQVLGGLAGGVWLLRRDRTRRAT